MKVLEMKAFEKCQRRKEEDENDDDEDDSKRSLGKMFGRSEDGGQMDCLISFFLFLLLKSTPTEKPTLKEANLLPSDVTAICCSVCRCKISGWVNNSWETVDINKSFFGFRFSISVSFPFWGGGR